MAPMGDVVAVKEWLSKQPHLPQHLEDRIIWRFLERFDGSLERTKAGLDLFFSARTNAPELFSDRDPLASAQRASFDYMDLLPLQDVTPGGCRCFLLRFSDQDPDKFNFVNILKMFFMIGDLELCKDQDLARGLVTIFDMTGWSLKLVPRLNLPALGRSIQYAQDTVPVKVKQIHFVNAGPLLDKVLALIRPFVRAETVARFHSHPTGSDSLYQFVPKDILPEEYGGKAGTIQEIKGKVREEIESGREWFLKDEWMSNESKRVGKIIGAMHMQGSFRSLSLD